MIRIEPIGVDPFMVEIEIRAQETLHERGNAEFHQKKKLRARQCSAEFAKLVTSFSI